MTFLVLRPEPQAGRMVGALAAAGVAAVAAPMLRIVPTADAARRIRMADPLAEALILTSPQAARLLGEDPEAAPLRSLPVVAVGPGTAEAARAAGFASVVAAGGDADSVVDLVRDLPYRKLIHAAGRDRVGDIPGRLAKEGRTVGVVEVYRAEAVETLPPMVAYGLGNDAFSGIVVASARTARSFLDTVAATVGLAHLGRLGLVAMSEAAAEPLAAHCAQTLIAERPDGAALMEATIALAARLDHTGGRTTGKPDQMEGPKAMASNKEAGGSRKAQTRNRPEPPVVDLEATEVSSAPSEPEGSVAPTEALVTTPEAEAAEVEISQAPAEASPEAPPTEASAASPLEPPAESPVEASAAAPAEEDAAALLSERPPSAASREDKDGGDRGEAGSAREAPPAVGLPKLMASAALGAILSLAVAGGALYGLGWLPPSAPAPAPAAGQGVAVDLSSLQSRVDELAARLDKAGAAASAADLDALSGRVAKLESAAGSAVPENGATVAPDAFAGLEGAVSDIKGEVDGLKATVATLAAVKPVSADDLAALSGRIAALEPLDARVAALETTMAGRPREGEIAALSVAAVGLSARIAAGLPFASELEVATKAAPDLPELAGLKAVAKTGVPTLSTLLSALPEDAIMAKRPVETGKGWMAGVVEGAKSLVNYRESAPTSDDPASRAIATIRASLVAGDSAAAETAAATLPDWAKAAAGSWLVELGARAEADRAVSALAGRIVSRLDAPAGGN